MYVKPKKHLGQHFLTDLSIAKRIADKALEHKEMPILEIGPGTGVLTQFIFKNCEQFKVVEIDTESVEYLNRHFEGLEIIEGDFLRLKTDSYFGDTNFCVAGNFPYNISTQILFRVLENKDQIPYVVGMFQKEVAERIASKPGSKIYGITSVLLQAFYDIEYLFTVDENVFNPPPKVKSAVIELKRNNVKELACNEKLFFTVVKTAFNQRRKTLRNSLKSLTANIDTNNPIFNDRPERLSVEQFIEITNLISAS